MKVYVAGSLKDVATVRLAQFLLSHFLKWEVSFDWTPHADLYNKTSSTLAEESVLDTKGVDDADIIIAILTNTDFGYRGTFFELGYALAQGKIVYIVDLTQSNHRIGFKTCPFYYHPKIVLVDSIENLILSLKSTGV